MKKEYKEYEEYEEVEQGARIQEKQGHSAPGSSSSLYSSYSLNSLYSLDSLYSFFFLAPAPSTTLLQ